MDVKTLVRRRASEPGGGGCGLHSFPSRFQSCSFRAPHWLTPASRWLGFRMDVPVSTVKRTPSLRLVSERRVNLFGIWQLLQFERI